MERHNSAIQASALQTSAFQTSKLQTSKNRQRATLSIRAGLAALLLWAGGTIPLVASANPAAAPLETAQSSISNNIIYVNPQLGNNDFASGNSEGDAYRTITHALKQAKFGSVIQLAPGTYNEENGEVFPLEIKPGVTLRGDAATKGQGILIEGSGVHTSPSFARQNVTLTAESGSVIEGLTVTNRASRGTGLWIEYGSPTVSNNTFSDSLRDGIFVTGKASPIIENNLFVNNSANGISVARAAKGEIRGNQFRETGFGIAIGDVASPTVIENGIYENNDGIVISNAAKPVLRGNSIENNNRNGVVIIADGNPDLGTASDPGNNRIRNNAGKDLFNATASQTITAIGNDIDADKIAGRVNFVQSDVQVALSDVGGHWAEAYITALTSKGIIAGFPDGTYRPNQPVTRAQFAAIVNNAFAPKSQRTATSFADVSTGFWAYKAIQSAYRGRFLAGYPGRVFRPNQQIPKVQAIVALSSGLDLRSDNTSVLSRYEDASQIPGYAETAIAGATQSEMVVNYPNLDRFDPNRPATRAEVAAFVYQALVNSGQAEAIPSPYIVATP
ncbi:MAG: DUF1565 domain-containing protein [Oscillatoria sp. SIO1A7]|nr:DUF1565 domain-containing protein [Oscillatoria sp. SIO1A7]